MKHLAFISALWLTATFGYAQNISEPEYKGQVVLINADSTTTLLQKELGEQKVKASSFGMIPLPGTALLDKTKAYLSVKGTSSPNRVSPGSSLIIRVKDNSEEPKNAFGIFKFDVKKKERRYPMADIGILSGAKVNTNFTTIDYVVKKFGESSYLVTLHDLPVGEYGVVAGDFSNVTTFSVK